PDVGLGALADRPAHVVDPAPGRRRHMTSAQGQAGQGDDAASAYHRRAGDQGGRPELRPAVAPLAIAHGNHPLLATWTLLCSTERRGESPIPGGRDLGAVPHHSYRAVCAPPGPVTVEIWPVRRRRPVARYPNIGDHGLIGDLQTAALVTTDGVLDWFCCPRFDSPSVFASLLDAGRGGVYRIAPDREDYVSTQLYLPETAVLSTRFMTADGVGEVHDFMPVIEGAATGRHRLVRNIRVVRGVMRFVIEIQPRFDYGRQPHQLEITEHGAVFRSAGMELTLHGI